MRFLLLSPALLLVSCVDPYGNPMSPFGPQQPAPYSGPREEWRNQNRDQGQEQERQAYERGVSDGRADGNARLGKNYKRHYQSYTPATQTAYRQGYDQGYAPEQAPPSGPGYGYGQGMGGWQQPGGTYVPPYPGSNNGYPQSGGNNYPGGGGYNNTPPPSPAPSNDPVYQQGYDYGLRDRVSGRQNDPGAHTGRYDPRSRRSFERGYSDAYNAR